MKKMMIAALTFALVFNLTGCDTVRKQDIGVVTGGVAGGLLGSQFGNGTGKLFAVGAGTLLGAYLGGSIGKSMDEQDQLKTQLALEKNRSGQPAYWHNPDNGNRYTVTPKKAVQQRGHYCREYTMTAEIAGKKQQTYGRACRQADGTWKVQGN